MKKKFSLDLINNIVPFILWPILTSFYLLFSSKGNKPLGVFFLYIVCGFTFMISLESFDSFRYVEYFIEVSKLDYQNFFDEIKYSFSLEGFKPDVFHFSLMFFLSRLTLNSSILFISYGILLGSIFYKIIKEIQTFEGVFLNKGFILFIFLIVLFLPYRMNSFRHYYAAMIFVFLILKYVKTDKIKYLFYTIITSFIHFGFLSFLPIFFLFLLIRFKYRLYYILVIIGFIFSNIFIANINNISTNSELGQLAYSAERYTDDNTVEQMNINKSETNIILAEYGRISSFILFFLSVFIFHKYKRFLENSIPIKTYYSLNLLFFAFLMFTRNFYVLNNRFTMVYLFMITILFILYGSKINLLNNKLFFYLFIFVFIICFVIGIRLFLETFSIGLLMPILPISYLFFGDINVYEFLF